VIYRRLLANLLAILLRLKSGAAAHIGPLIPQSRFGSG